MKMFLDSKISFVIELRNQLFTTLIAITGLHEITENQTAALVPELVGSHLTQLVELDFFGEDIERDVDWAT